MRFDEIRDGLKHAITDATGLRCYADEPDTVSPPCAVVRPSSPFALYRQRMGRSVVTTWRLEVLLITGRIAEQAGLRKLDGFVSPDGPVIQAINNYVPGDGVSAGTAVVTEGVLFGPVVVGTATYLGSQLAVEITV